MRSRQYLLNDMDVIVVLHPDSVKEFRAANWLQGGRGNDEEVRFRPYNGLHCMRSVHRAGLEPATQ
jgi:hypothetical protein